ncbi:hypothetical protein BDW72DRAFT_199653 [Aspergillus terricola var. indicus]
MQGLGDTELETLLPKFVSLLLQSHSSASPLKVVDFGCGTGRNTLKLIAMLPGAKVVGLDATPALLEVAEKRCNEAYASLPDNLRPSGLSFKGLISTLVLEHLPLADFFRMCSSIVVPGGYLLVTNTHEELAGIAHGSIVEPEPGAKLWSESHLHANEAVKNGGRKWGFDLVEVQEGVPEDPDMVGAMRGHWDGVKCWKMIISSDHSLDYNGAGLAIFTSGTSGPPKCAVRRRRFLDMMTHGIATWNDLSEADVVLHTLPFLPFLLAGATIEFRSSGFKEAEIWERWRRGGLTIFSGVPTMYMRLMRYYEEVLAKRPDAQVYREAAGAFRIMMSGSAALLFLLQVKWARLRGGKRILERYGTTEFGSAFSVKPGDLGNPNGSVGKIFPGVEVKLTNGARARFCWKVRICSQIARYMFDPQATAAAFTADGWYKTGDVAKRQGDYFFILGRASIDIIKSGGYKISALDIEREILGLSYVSEVMVVGVESEEFGQRVAAAVVLRKDTPPLGLEKLRTDLRSRLAGYKLPTLLRLVDELPKSASGKVVKRTLQKVLFPAQGHPEIQTWQSRKSKM